MAIGLLASGRASAQDTAGARIDTQQDVVRRGDEGAVEQRIQFRLTDPELGEIDLVSRVPKPKTFSFWTDQNLFYTSNAFLVPNRAEDTIFWNGHLAGSVVPYSTVNFTPRITFDQNFFRYDEFSILDFDSSSLQFDMKYDFKRDDSCFVNLSYTGAMLYSPQDDIGEFYTYGLVNGSFTHSRPLGQWPLNFWGTIGSTWRHGDPSDFDRVTAYLNLGLYYFPMATVQLSAFVRPELQCYLHEPISSSRRDFNFSTGLSASWIPNDYVSLGATVSFTGNYSSVDLRDYDVFLPSIFVAARVAF